MDVATVRLHYMHQMSAALFLMSVAIDPLHHPK
jgi:hypothetical protein